MVDQLFSYPQYHPIENSLIQHLQLEKGVYELADFPDGETYIRVHSQVNGKGVAILSDLANPNPKLPDLLFLASTIRDLGASRITIIIPYLPYMRQDKQFNPGEGITSKYFASFLGLIADQIITVEPHLHRWESLASFYPIPTQVIQTDEKLAQFLQNLNEPAMLVGPDSESEQWVSRVSEQSDIPYMVLEKKRHSSNTVTLTYEGSVTEKNLRPVILDDIVSTAGTMEKCVKFLVGKGFQPPICIAIHALMNDTAIAKLEKAGAFQVISTNTVPNKTNSIDIARDIINTISQNKL